MCCTPSKGEEMHRQMLLCFNMLYNKLFGLSWWNTLSTVVETWWNIKKLKLWMLSQCIFYTKMENHYWGRWCFFIRNNGPPEIKIQSAAQQNRIRIQFSSLVTDCYLWSKKKKATQKITFIQLQTVMTFLPRLEEENIAILQIKNTQVSPVAQLNSGSFFSLTSSWRKQSSKWPVKCSATTHTICFLVFIQAVRVLTPCPLPPERRPAIVSIFPVEEETMVNADNASYCSS